MTELSSNHLIREGKCMIQMLALITTQEQQILCSGSCQSGIAYDEITRTARSLNADLIVMGTHTGSDLPAFQTNNEAYQVIKTAPCPVLTVPDNHKRTTFARILFPVRPIPDAAAKYDFARNIIRSNVAKLIILALTVPNEVVSMDQLQDALTELSEKLVKDEIKSQILFYSTDSLAETVLEKADELQSDLLIITAQLTTASDNFFIGPFTQQIIHNAHMPLLSIRPEAHPASTVGQLFWLYNRMDLDFTAVDL